MADPIVFPGTVEWSGENPGISLKDQPDGPFVALASFFRVVLSPHGRGHALVLLQAPESASPPRERANYCLHDNEALEYGSAGWQRDWLHLHRDVADPQSSGVSRSWGRGVKTAIRSLARWSPRPHHRLCKNKKLKASGSREEKFMWTPFLVLCAAFLLLTTGAASAQGSTGPGGKPIPKLVLFMVVDGFPRDQLVKYYDQYGAGGFRLWLDRGAWFGNNHYSHATTYTGVGHATLLSCAHPESPSGKFRFLINTFRRGAGA